MNTRWAVLETRFFSHWTGKPRTVLAMIVKRDGLGGVAVFPSKPAAENWIRSKPKKKVLDYNESRRPSYRPVQVGSRAFRKAWFSTGYKTEPPKE